MQGQMRRIITGHDANGQSIVVRDEQINSHLTIPSRGVEFIEFWRAGSLPTNDMIWDYTTAEGIRIEPGPGGINFRYIDYPPLSAVGDQALAVDQGPARFAAMGSPDAHVVSDRHPAMHRTSTLDIGVVLSGEMTLVLDEEDVHLKSGDVVVQRGTSHAWENRGEQLCRMLFILMDAAELSAGGEPETNSR